MDKKKDEVDYAAAYRQFMNFGHGRSLKQFCEDEDYDYGKLQRYSRVIRGRFFDPFLIKGLKYPVRNKSH